MVLFFSFDAIENDVDSGRTEKKRKEKKRQNEMRQEREETGLEQSRPSEIDCTDYR